MQKRVQNKQAEYKSDQFSVVDVFCGIGGMTHGFLKEGFHVAAGVDVDTSCKYAFEVNNKGARFIQGDLEQMGVEEIRGLYPEGQKKILIGCAPCQPFSKYTNRKSEDDKWKLLYTFSHLIEEINPEIVSMENVPGLKRYKKHSVYNDFEKTLIKHGYHVSSFIVHCPVYGVPQTRTRLVFFASKFGDIQLIPETHPPSRRRTVREVIGKLPKLTHGRECKSDPLHRSSELSEINFRRIRATPAGGSWKNWDAELVSECHKKKSGKTYVGVYGRMDWNQLAPTMTTQCYGFGNGRFGHPSQNRAISLREAAMFQTFPKYYRMINPEVKEVSMKAIARHIGNAVPVRLGRVIARSIQNHLNDYA